MSQLLRASEVFTPGSFPLHTYVAREDTTIAQHLVDTLEVKGQLISIVGPSKSGKTVLVEKTVGRDNLLVITGAGISGTEDIWNRFLDLARAPNSRLTEDSKTNAVSAEIVVEGQTSVWGLISSKLGLKSKFDAARGTKQGASYGRRGLEDLIDLFADTSAVLLIDDFHYMDRKVQVEATKALKEATRRGLRVVVAAVGHRADDIGRANPEMRGRVELIEIDYWSHDELAQIALLGFNALNVGIATSMLNGLVTEAAGSPQLMQLICLNVCRQVGVRQQAKAPITIDLSEDRVAEVFRKSSTAADYRSLVEVLEAGPLVRGTSRKQFHSQVGWYGDVYSIVLLAISLKPLRLTFTYDDLLERAKEACDGDAPTGASITVCCAQMQKLALKKFPDERVIDWDEQKQILSIADPHFLFYLRWSGKLQEIPE